MLTPKEASVIKLIALLKRKPGLSQEEFAQRWVKEHTKISSRLPDLRGYYINICTPRQPEGTGDEPLYDGTAELWWDSIDAMEASFATDIGRLAGADGDAFTIVRMHLYTEEHTIVPFKGHAPRRTAKRKPGKPKSKAKAALKHARK
jgi:uncharacterized protein (TIGR02118 family)